MWSNVLKRSIPLLTLCFLNAWALAARLHAEDAVQVPAGIRYKAASAEVNEQAQQLLRQRFTAAATDQDVLSLFEPKTLICGPGLWHDVQHDAALAKITSGKVVFQVPVLGGGGTVAHTQHFEGKLFQSPEEVLAFWNALKQRTDFGELKARKLNPDELRIFWSMISFDITEPLFILESKKQKVLVAFTSPENLKICWIDDFQNVALKKDASSNATDPDHAK